MNPAKLVMGIVVLTCANVAFAANITVEVTQPPVLPGFTAYGIFWDGGGTEDWTGAAINIDLTSGSFYQNPFGGDGPPAPVLIGAFPQLEFDTYFGIIGDGSPNPACTAEDTGGGCFGIINDTQISGTWSNTRTTDTGLVNIGNFTVSNDASGAWALASGGIQNSGIIIPEPASLAIFGLAGMALLRRR